MFVVFVEVPQERVARVHRAATTVAVSLVVDLVMKPGIVRGKFRRWGGQQCAGIFCSGISHGVSCVKAIQTQAGKQKTKSGKFLLLSVTKQALKQEVWHHTSAYMYMSRINPHLPGT